MSDQKEHKPGQENLDEIRQRRMQTLIGVWDSLIKHHMLPPEKFRFSVPLANEVVEHYIADRDALKRRYQIKDRIQLYKIAGLMTASLIRYRPIIPATDSLSPGKEFFANELLAIYHAIAICAEHSDKNYALGLLDEEWFTSWRDEMIYFLHFRNHTPESLCMIFMTLMQLRFHDNLLAGHD